MEKTIDQKIRILAKSSNYSLREIANLSGITPSGLSRYLAGKTQLRADAFLRLLGTLGIQLERDLDKKLASHVDAQHPANVEEALGFCYRLLPNLEKRRVLKLLLRHLDSKKIKNQLSAEIVAKELMHERGTLELRREA